MARMISHPLTIPVTNTAYTYCISLRSYFSTLLNIFAAFFRLKYFKSRCCTVLENVNTVSRMVPYIIKSLLKHHGYIIFCSIGGKNNYVTQLFPIYRFRFSTSNLCSCPLWNSTEYFGWLVY